jgi:hypothetical protein
VQDVGKTAFIKKIIFKPFQNKRLHLNGEDIDDANELNARKRNKDN